MTWLIIILAMALIISPLVSSLPSKKQRALGRLRQYALIKGFRIERIEEAGHTYRGYRWQRALPVEDERFSSIILPSGHADLVTDLPLDVVRVELHRGSILVVWDEQGDESDIDKLAEYVEQQYRAYP